MLNLPPEIMRIVAAPIHRAKFVLVDGPESYFFPVCYACGMATVLYLAKLDNRMGQRRFSPDDPH